MKKSLLDARERAEKLSKSGDETVRVMDKPHHHAVVCSSTWVNRERVLDGWTTVAVFCEGQEVQLKKPEGI